MEPFYHSCEARYIELKDKERILLRVFHDANQLSINYAVKWATI